MARLPDEHEQDGKQPRRRMILQLLWLWVLLVVLYFSWEVATYRGLFAIIAEWQFERLGQDLPTFDFMALAVAFSWPALLLVRARFRSKEQSEPEGATPAQVDIARDKTLAAAILETAEEYMHVLFGFAAALAIAAMVALVWTLFLPRVDRDPTPLAPYSETVSPREGPTSFDGQLTYGRIASFGRGILFLRHTVLYAPLKPPGGDPGVRYFVEFLPDERADIRAGGSISHRAGILVRGDMPGALIRLYRYLGYRIAPRYYVLYASQWTMRWPYYMLAVQFALAAFAFLIVALWQRLHLRRLGEDIAALDRRQVAVRQRKRRTQAAAGGAGGGFTVDRPLA